PNSAANAVDPLLSCFVRLHAHRRIMRALDADGQPLGLFDEKQAAVEAPFDIRVILELDVQLPIMDGYTATRRIKADPALRSITIIAVTSYALDGEEKTARAAGCDDYVPKPFSPRELLAKIRQHLS